MIVLRRVERKGFVNGFSFPNSPYAELNEPPQEFSTDGTQLTEGNQTTVSPVPTVTRDFFSPSCRRHQLTLKPRRGRSGWKAESSLERGGKPVRGEHGAGAEEPGCPPKTVHASWGGCRERLKGGAACTDLPQKPRGRRPGGGGSHGEAEIPSRQRD